MLSSITSVATISLLAASSLAASVPIKREYECSSLLPTTISVNGTALSTTETTHINEGDVLSSEFYTGHGASCNGAISIGMAKGDKIPDSIFSSDWRSTLTINNPNSVKLTPDFNTNCGNYTAFLFQYSDSGAVTHTFYSAPIFYEGYYNRPDCNL